jgi:hypothetical protein
MKAQTLPLVMFVFVFAILTFIDRGSAQSMAGSNSVVPPTLCTEQDRSIFERPHRGSRWALGILSRAREATSAFL